MRSGNREYVAAGQYVLGQPLRSGRVTLTAIEDRFHERVAARDDVSDHPYIGFEGQLLFSEALDQFDAQCLELLAHRRVDVGVATGDPVASSLRDGRDSA